jgi:hypothetical protein
MTGTRPVAQELPAGIHILENLPPGSRSPKVDHVREMLGTVGGADLKGEALLGRLRRVLGDHSLPDKPDGSARPNATVTVGDQTGAEQSTSRRTSSEQAASGQSASQTGASQSLTTVPEPVRPPGTLVACVHTETYGTRSSTIVRVPASADAQIFVSVADGPPCRTPFVDADGLWRP